MTDIGVKEFARIIGVHHADISCAVRDGIIAPIKRGASFGPGNTVLEKADAERIGAAVQCGIHWRDAAKMGARLEVKANGVFIRGGA